MAEFGGWAKARLGVWSVLIGILISALSVHSFKVTVLSHSSSNCIQLLHVYNYTE